MSKLGISYLLLAVLAAIGSPGHADCVTSPGQFPCLESDGNGNSAFGSNSMQSNTTGSNNTASGYNALQANSTGDGNTADGVHALSSNTAGRYNTAIGRNALFFTTTGSFNTASGVASLYGNTIGHRNTATGDLALSSNIDGGGNTASGSSALQSNSSGSYNTAAGYRALNSNTTGRRNVALGAFAAYYPTTGSNNIHIGNAGGATDSGTIRIGTQGTQSKTFVAGIRGVTVSDGAAVIVSRTGQLGVQNSSRRFKEDIRPMAEVSAALLKLSPVTFRYKQTDEQGEKPVQFGLIAEEVAKVLPELVVYDENGRPETVAYQMLSSLLLNEFQKEHERGRKDHDKLVAVEAQTKIELASLKAQAALASARADAATQELTALKADMAQLKQVARQWVAPRSSIASVAQFPP